MSRTERIQAALRLVTDEPSTWGGLPAASKLRELKERLRERRQAPPRHGDPLEKH